MTQSTLHRRQLDFQSWPELLADIDHLRQARYDRMGNWDLSQTLEHIGEGIRTAMRGTPHQGAWIVRQSRRPIDPQANSESAADEGRHQGARLVASRAQSRRVRCGRAVPLRGHRLPGHDAHAVPASVLRPAHETTVERPRPRSRRASSQFSDSAIDRERSPSSHTGPATLATVLVAWNQLRAPLSLAGEGQG